MPRQGLARAGGAEPPGDAASTAERATGLSRLDNTPRVNQEERAQLFRRLHHEPPILVLANAWDVGSARLVERLPGCRAIATSSASFAWALGYPDGERDLVLGGAGTDRARLDSLDRALGVEAPL